MIRTYSYTITSASATALTVADADVNNGRTLWLYAEFHGSSSKIAIGGPDVTIETGLHIYHGEKFGPIGLGKDEVLYAISDDAGGLDLRVLATQT